jgi:DNA sulfur modification protein DndD
MILTRLAVNDFGVFGGQHGVHLSPKDGRPIILFGGKNGAGKSTLLEALMLCLYGPGALGIAVSKEEYLTYLESRIHINPNALIQPTFASVLIEFQYGHSEGLATYTLTRSWERRGAKKLSEYLTVERNGKPLEEIEAEHWQDFIHELIPPGVSQLFFFDGEKIQQLAEDTTDQQTLADAIKSLLGVDTVERLETDLRIHLSRLNKPNCNTALVREISKIEIRIDRLKNQLERARQQRVQQESGIQELRARVARVENKLASQGGIFARGRERLIQEHATLKERITQNEGTIRDLCAGLLPFALAPYLCRRLREQLSLEDRSTQFMAGRALLDSAKRELAKRLQPDAILCDLPGLSQTTKDQIHARVAQALDEPLTVERDEPIECFHGLSETTHRLISAWINEAITEMPETIRSLASDLEKSYRELQKTEEALHKIPADEVLKPLIEDIHRLNEKLAKSSTEALIKDQAIKELELQLGESERLHAQLANKLAAETNQSGKLHLLPRLQRILEDYRRALIDKKVSHLQEAVTECFNLLSRKKDPLRKIRIDPKDFSVTLYNRQNRPLPKSQLSAGEKQIYAISMLWALGKTSGRPLPIVIDTPLARLDTDHRRLLIEHYFRLASHQVIILSTDTEVDQSYFYELRPAVAHAYHLDFDQSQSSTVVKHGYFWKERDEAYKVASN